MVTITISQYNIYVLDIIVKCIETNTKIIFNTHLKNNFIVKPYKA